MTSYLVETWKCADPPDSADRTLVDDADEVLRIVSEAIWSSQHVNVWRVEISKMELALSTHPQTRQGFDEQTQKE